MKNLTIIFILSIFILPLRISSQDSVYHRANEWKEQLQRYYKQDSVSFPGKGQVLFVGSSSIGMWKNLPASFPGHPVFGRGFGGSRMSDLLFHMQRLVIDYRPAQIVLYCGENDISNGVSPQDLLYDVKTFVRILELHLPGVPLLILSIKPSPLLFKLIEKQKEANRLIEEFCQTKSHLRFIDITKFMVDESGTPRKDLYLTDGLHVNTQAYCMWAQAIEKFLIK